MRITPNKLLMALALAVVCVLALVALVGALVTGSIDDAALGMERIRFMAHPLVFAALVCAHLAVAGASGVGAWRTFTARIPE